MVMTMDVVTFRARRSQWATFRRMCARHGVSPGERLRRLIAIAIKEAAEWPADTPADS